MDTERSRTLSRLQASCWSIGVGRHYSYVSPDGGENCKTSMAGSAQSPKEIPRSLIKRLTESKSIHQGIMTLGKVAFSAFDMQIHYPISHEAVRLMDIDEVYNSLLQTTTLLQGPGHDFK